MRRLTFIGGTLHGETAPQTSEDRIMAINDGTVYIRRALQHPERPAEQAATEFFVFEALRHEEAATLAQTYW